MKGLGPCLFGTLGLVFLMPPNIIGGKYVEKLQDQQLQEKDLRIKVYATLIKKSQNVNKQPTKNLYHWFFLHQFSAHEWNTQWDKSTQIICLGNSIYGTCE